ncbi:MAG: hypothetical protein IJ403_01620 [Oscillospiraceae bacterium]|nr:hypothetical protein [Oscillospiraceae bacterium]
MYITFEEYATIYGSIDDGSFYRLAFDACRYIDRHTTGIDGVKKLKVAFPSDEDSAEAVKRCAAEIVNLLFQIQEAEKNASVGRGYLQTENGLQGKVVTSVSAGNESVSYSTGSFQSTEIDVAAADRSVRDRLISSTVRDYLSGVSDANGVNLLYMGVYPCV